MSASKEIVGYDTSEDMYDHSAICVECSDEEGDGGGSPIFADEEWGGGAPTCDCCGAEIPVTSVWD